MMYNFTKNGSASSVVNYPGRCNICNMLDKTLSASEVEIDSYGDSAAADSVSLDAVVDTSYSELTDAL